MARIIYDQTYYIILHCEECGLMTGDINAEYFSSDGHLAGFDEIRTPAMARIGQRIHQKWHDSQINALTRLGDNYAAAGRRAAKANND